MNIKHGARVLLLDSFLDILELYCVLVDVVLCILCHCLYAVMYYV